MTAADRGRLDATRAAFEDMAALLDARGTAAAQTDPQLPVPALPSLLERCEEIAARRAAPYGRARLLICFPGLAPLEPGFWKGRVPGLSVIRQGADLPAFETTEDAALAGRATAAALGVLRAAAEHDGRDLLVLAGAADPIPTAALAIPDMQLLTCHPLVAFHLGRGYLGDELHTLETFARRLADSHDAHPDIPVLRIEDLAADDATALCTQLGYRPLRRQAQSLLVRTPDSLIEESVPKGLCPSYDRLCERLEYDPTVPEPDWYAAERRPARRRRGRAMPRQTAKIGSLAGIAALANALRARTGTPTEATITLGGLAVETALHRETDFVSAFDDQLATLPQASAVFAQLAAAAMFAGQGNKLQSAGLVAEALEIAPPAERWPRWLGAAIYLELNMENQAVIALAGEMPDLGIWAPEAMSRLAAVLGKHEITQEHGHSLLVSYLAAHPPASSAKRSLMIEIGTTREHVPGQGSTEKLASLCHDLDMDFITVDMDPRNGRIARRMFRRRGYEAQAITEKGEDFLARHPGPFDFVFLDAYDFDHGMHSEERQSRYQQFLGSRIEEEQCHRMHLDCARTLLEKLAPDGLICFDDTWLDEKGNWTAKGTTAMPFLLENGFEVIEARNRAALLRRVH